MTELIDSRWSTSPRRCGEEWSSLSIPRGTSQAYNQDARYERAGAHADALKKRDER